MKVAGWLAARFKKVLVLLLLGLLIQPAQAGSRHPNTASAFSTSRVAVFAKKVEKYAASKGARVFLIARLGAPQADLPEGVQFTHVGLAIYSSITTADGKEVHGYAIHNLYQKAADLAHSELLSLIHI